VVDDRADKRQNGNGFTYIKSHLPEAGRLWQLQPSLPMLTTADIMTHLRTSGRPDVPIVRTEQVERQRQAVLGTISLKAVWLWLDRAKLLEQTEFVESITGCTSLPGVVLYALTAGAAIDRHSRRSSCLDLMDGFLFDFISNLYLFRAAAICHQRIKAIMLPGGLQLGRAVFPGDGKLDLSVQRLLCQWLDTERRIGLTVTRTAGALQPLKSLVATAPLLPVQDRGTEISAASTDGVSQGEHPKSFLNVDAEIMDTYCDGCPRKVTCIYRNNIDHMDSMERKR